MEPSQCVEELEDDVFQPEDGEPGTQPGSLLSADLFAQSLLDCPLSRLQLFPLTHCCGPGLRPTSQEDKATQTLSPASPSQGVMLPCGVTEEPQRLFYGNAGYRLPLPASFPAVLPLGEQPPEGQWQHRAEVQIARKLQCIADQFHRLHVQQLNKWRPIEIRMTFLQRHNQEMPSWALNPKTRRRRQDFAWEVRGRQGLGREEKKRSGEGVPAHSALPRAGLFSAFPDFLPPL
uniref:Bcl2 modifying factor n=1 Tax=Callithrix jacchus TaxID=9483 RepID=A0A8I3WWH5_CALJA